MYIYLSDLMSGHNHNLHASHRVAYPLTLIIRPRFIPLTL